MQKKKKQQGDVQPSVNDEQVADEAHTETPAAEKTPQALADEYMLGWKRALADYENLKRTSAEEKAAFAKYATASLIQDLIPTLDYFHAAMAHPPDLSTCTEEARKQVENWAQGLTHVQTLLMQQLTERGVSTVDVSGQFNAELHEAVEEQESDEPEGTILKVVAQGYKLHDQLLRPARVVIAKKSN